MSPSPRLRVLELNRVGKLYGSEPVVRALVDVDLWVERGEWLSITGPSGAGSQLCFTSSAASTARPAATTF